MYTFRRHLSLGLAAIPVLAVATCGGSDGTPTRSELLVFTARAEAPPSVNLYHDPSDTSAPLVFELRAEGVERLAAVVFDLEYPAHLLEWRLSSHGDLLRGESRTTPIGGGILRGFVGPPTSTSPAARWPEVDGTGVLLRIHFRPVASGRGTLRFVSSNAVNGGPVDATGRRESLDLPPFGGGEIDIRL